MLLICSSIVISNKLTDCTFFSITKALNSSELANISFLVHHSVAHFDSDYRISFSLSKVFAKLESALSSAKLWTVACCAKKKKLLKNALNSTDPNTELSGTPEIISLKSLLILLTRTHCFLLSKYEFILVNFCLDLHYPFWELKIVWEVIRAINARFNVIGLTRNDRSTIFV